MKPTSTNDDHLQSDNGQAHIVSPIPLTDLQKAFSDKCQISTRLFPDCLHFRVKVGAVSFWFLLFKTFLICKQNKKFTKSRTNGLLKSVDEQVVNNAGSISSTRKPILWQHSPFAPPRGWIQKNLDSIIRPLVGEPASVLSPHGPGHLTIPSCPDPISALNYEHQPRNCSTIAFVKWDLRGKHTINGVY